MTWGDDRVRVSQSLGRDRFGMTSRQMAADVERADLSKFQVRYESLGGGNSNIFYFHLY